MNFKNTEQWVPWNLFDDSAADDFMYQLWNGKGICVGDWHGKYVGENLLGDNPKYIHWEFKPNGDFVLANKFYMWWGYPIDTWATKFTLTYDDGKAGIAISNDDGSKYLSASCHVDWDRFCYIWNRGGVTPGIGWDKDDSELPVEMFDKDGDLKYDPDKHMLTFKNKITLTEGEFVHKVMEAVANCFEFEFEHEWIWLVEHDGWFKQIKKWAEFNKLISEQAELKAQDGIDQFEVEAKLQNGDMLYGYGAGDIRFIRDFLKYGGDMDYRFKMPLPISN